MTELVFSKRDGWSPDDATLFDIIAKRYLILTEESMGLTACTITIHNLLHVREDAMRFSHSDNFWCFNFERAVKCYVRIPSNFKNFLCSFAKRESRLKVKLLKVISSNVKSNRSLQTSTRVDLEKVSLLYLIENNCLPLQELRNKTLKDYFRQKRLIEMGVESGGNTTCRNRETWLKLNLPHLVTVYPPCISLFF